MKHIPIALGLALFSAPAAADTAPSLALPLKCSLGKDCFIQQLTDIDPGPGARDYRCGGATYSAHKGTDFRILSAKAVEAGVPVLASAAGQVKGVRDGMQDRLMAKPEDAALVKDRECGNGVVIDHGGGWETQYCHMRRGSVQVKQGQRVGTGTALGMVGYSGAAQFAHVHLSVRLNGQIVDPFLGEAISGRCLPDTVGNGMWAPGVIAAQAYPDAAIIQAGFSGAAVSPEQAEAGTVSPAEPGAAGLVFFVHLINMRQGDRVRVSVVGPGEFAASNETAPIDRYKANYVAFAGKKLRAERWLAGEYRGTAEVVRAGKVIGTTSKTASFQ
jgi:hypothetical protein